MRHAATRAAVAALAAWLAAAPAPAAALEVVNGSGKTLVRVWVSPHDLPQWGPDQLDGAEAPPGSVTPLFGVAPQVLDLKVETADGRSCVIEDVDFAARPSYQVTDYDFAQCESW